VRGVVKYSKAINYMSEYLAIDGCVDLDLEDDDEKRHLDVHTLGSFDMYTFYVCCVIIDKRYLIKMIGL